MLQSALSALRKRARANLIHLVAIFALSGAAGLLLAPTAQAMSVSPMVGELTVAGAGSTVRIEIGNEGAAPLPYEIAVYNIGFDAQGKPVETRADEDFLIF